MHQSSTSTLGAVAVWVFAAPAQAELPTGLFAAPLTLSAKVTEALLPGGTGFDDNPVVDRGTPGARQREG